MKRSDVLKRIKRVIGTIYFFLSKTPSKYGRATKHVRAERRLHLYTFFYVQ